MSIEWHAKLALGTLARDRQTRPMLTVGRLAPSPTGSLHLGHALSFLIAWWSARSQGGKILLRLEDVDAARSCATFNQGIIDDLIWLGLDWDGPPIIQSNRLSLLQKAAQTLLDQRDAYPCHCTRAEIRRRVSERAALLTTTSESGMPESRTIEGDIAESGAPQQGTMEQRYPGTCRGRFTSVPEAEKNGREAGLRFVTRPGSVEVNDKIQGTHLFDVDAEVGDFQIMRRDKAPAYQLAVVVDDHLDQVTEVVRGRDLLSSAARQIQIAGALGFASPHYLHLPLVCDENGVRLAKRHDSLSLRKLREAGVTAAEIVGWVAKSARQLEPSPTSPTSASAQHQAGDLITRFDLSKIPQGDLVVPERFSKLQ